MNSSCCWCISIELGGRRVQDSLVKPLWWKASHYLQAITSYLAESHLESSKASKMEPFHENSQRPQHVGYFSKKGPTTDV